MEIKEAIRVLNEVKLMSPEGQASFKAIEALEKQIPKKPIKDREQNIRYTSAYSCPACGNGFSGTGVASYCYHCGQKLNWN